MPQNKMTITSNGYNTLCHELRHLVMLAKRVDKKSTKFHSILVSMVAELAENRSILIEKIQGMERYIESLDATLRDCKECLNRYECDKE